MRAEGKVTNRQMWRVMGYLLIVIAIFSTSSFPLSVVTASAAGRTGTEARLGEKTATTTTPAPAPTTTSTQEKSKSAPTTPEPTSANKPASAPKPRYSGLSTPVTFTSTGSLTIKDKASASPYPSTITVTGVSGNVLAATVTLTGLTHTYSGDIDMILVGPAGQNTYIMSDVGTNVISNLTMIFDDSASISLPSSGSISSGTYKPTNYDKGTCITGSNDDAFASPAPASPYETALSVFNGANPNGSWQLFVRDDCGGDSGSLSSWSVTLYAYQQPAIFAYAGSGQNTTIATSFATPLQALVKDSSGNPIAGADVTFTAPGTGASGTFADGSHTYTGTTDSNGIITATTFTANTTAGSYIVTATSSVSSVVANFSLINMVGNPATISATSGSNQTTNITNNFAQPLVATVYDIGNNPVSSQVVTFTAPGSGASGTFASNSNVYVGVTNASGMITTTTFTANSITGSYVVTATAGGSTSQVSFTLTNNPGSTVQFQNSSYAVNEGAGTAGITLTRGVNSSGTVTATVIISDITTSSSDYTATNFIAGGLDSRFDTTTGANGNVNDIVVQPDGKILIAGDFTTYNNTTRNRIARLNSDGTLDTSFDSSIGVDNGIGRIALQSDGKILIAGSFTTYNGVARNRVARLNTDGSLDTSFDSSIGANTDVDVVAVQADGQILIGGAFTTYNSVARNRVARLNTDGSLDTTFDSSTGANNIVWDLVVQPADSKVIIVGRFTTYNGTSLGRIARLNSDGSLDTSFNSGVGVSTNLDIWRITLQPDGKVLIGGDFLSFNGVGRIRIARLNSNGSLDTTFDPGTSSANNGVRPMVVQPDGKILTSGDFTTFNTVSRNRFTRLNSDGSLDTSFDVGSGANDFVAAIALQADGKILIGGRFTTYNGIKANRLVKLGTTTTVTWSAGDSAPKTITIPIVNDSLAEADEQLALVIDSTTNGATAASPVSTTLTILDNDVSTVQFQNSSYSVSEGAGTAVFTLMRGSNSSDAISATVAISDITTSSADYNATFYSGGSLDGTFSTTTGPNGNINDIVMQPDGKILIAGDFTAYNDVTRNHIARLNSDGSLDTSFDSSIGADNGIGRMALQPGGKILIVGSFTTYNGVTRNRVARLTSDGSLDTSFDSSIGADSDVAVVALQPNGKILIGGSFATYNNTSRNGVARLNPDGSLDTTFEVGTGTDDLVWDLVVQPADSKIIIVGRFDNYNNTSRNKIARLNTDGSLDTTFDPGVDVTGRLDIWRVALQPDGKVLIGGDFFNFNQVVRIRIARLNSDGSVDTSFSPGAMGANNGVRPIVVQPDGKILTAGDFTTFNGVSRNHFTRLNSDGSLDTSFDVGTGADDFVGAIALQPDGRILIGGRFANYNDASANRIARLGSVVPISWSDGDNITTVSWSDGDNTPKTITMTIVDDNLLEGNEQLALTVLSTSSGVTLVNPISTTLTIVDNDFPIISALSGNDQSTSLTTDFDQPLVARVLNINNQPIRQATVTFTAPDNGASGFFQTGTLTSTTYTGTTDIYGVITSTTFTANTLTGAYAVTATVSGAAAATSFELTNTLGAVSNIEAVSGSGQSTVVNTVFAIPLVARVLDNNNIPLSGIVVTFTAPASYASGTFANGTITYTGTTDASGLVTTTTFTANTVAADFDMYATSGGIAAHYILFNSPGPVVNFNVTTASAQATLINTTFPTITVKATDVYDNAAFTQPVTFTVPVIGASGTFAGNGSSTVFTTTFDIDGNATVAGFKANSFVGSYLMTATISNFAAPVIISLTNQTTYTATRVYGQKGSFTSSTANNGGISANSLNNPAGMSMDSSGNLYVADYWNNRVLYFPAGSTTATRVYGQNGSFTSNTANNGGISASSLFTPTDPLLDTSGGLYLTDSNNNRVLYFPAGSTTATRVYGQNGSFTSDTVNNGGISTHSFSSPDYLALDSSGGLYVSDYNNHRVLYFPAGSTTATRVYGQNGSFTANTANNGGVSATSLFNPEALTLDSSGGLYIADSGNNRVLYFPAGSTTATRVYGQNGSFTSNTVNNGGISASSLNSPIGLTLDKSGGLYVTEYLNNRVLYFAHDGDTVADRVYGQLGKFTTKAKNPNGVSAATILRSTSVLVDSADNLYISDLANNRVLYYPNQAVGSLQFESASYSQLEGSSFVIKVTRTGGSNMGAVAKVTATNLTASATDYSFTPSLLSWADGDSSPKYVTVTLNTDASQVATKTFGLNLSTYNGGINLGITTTTTITIRDSTCNSLQVTSTADDGSCGTLRNALSVASSGSSKTVTITLAAGSVITLTSGLTLGNGVSITTTTTCASTGPVITIRGSGNSSGDGLTLSKGNTLYNLWVRGFSGRQIIAPNGGGNILRCVKASKS